MQRYKFTKIIAILLLLSLSWMGTQGAFYLKKNRIVLLETLLAKALPYHITFQDYHFQNFRELTLNQLEIKNKNQEILLQSNSATICVNWLELFFTPQKIDSLTLSGTTIYLNVDAKGTVNFLAGLPQSSGAPFEFSSIPVKHFQLNDATLYLKDESKPITLASTLNHLTVKANYQNGTESVQLSSHVQGGSLTLSGNLSSKSYELQLSLYGIEITPAISQYIGPIKDSGTTLLSGVVNGELTITPTAWYGTLNVGNASINYHDLTANLIGLNGTITFNASGVMVDFNGYSEIESQKRSVEFQLTYLSKGEKLMIKIVLPGVYQEGDLNRYAIIAALKLNYEAVVENPVIDIAMSKGKLENVVVTTKVKKFLFNGLSITEGENQLIYHGSSGKLEISKVNGKLMYQGASIQGSVTNIFIDSTHATGNFDLENYNQLFYFNHLKGEFNFNFHSKTPTCYIFMGKNSVQYVLDPNHEQIALNLSIVDPIETTVKNQLVHWTAQGTLTGKDLYHLSGSGEVDIQHALLSKQVSLGFSGVNGIYSFHSLSENESDVAVIGTLNTQQGNNFVYDCHLRNLVTLLKNYQPSLANSWLYGNYDITGDFTQASVEYSVEVIEKTRIVATSQGKMNIQSFSPLQLSISGATLAMNNLVIKGIQLRIQEDEQGYEVNISNDQHQISYSGRFSSNLSAVNGSGSIENLQATGITMGQNTLLALNLGHVTIKTFGNLSSLAIELTCDQVEFQTNFSEVMTLTGSIGLNQKILTFNLLLNEKNTLKGSIDFGTQQVNISATVDSDDCAQFYRLEALEGVKLQAQLYVTGSFESLSFSGNVLANNLPIVKSISKGIEFIFNYDKISIRELFQKGTLQITQLSLLDVTNKSIYTLQGDYDFEHQLLNLQSQQTSIALDEFNLNGVYRGTLMTSFQLSGEIQHLNGGMTLQGSDVVLNGTTINTLDLNMVISNGKFSFSNGLLRYNQNQMVQLNGSFNPTLNQYNVEISGKSMDLSLWRPFVPTSIGDISGTANLDVILNNQGYTGNIEIINGGFSTLGDTLFFSKLNGMVLISNSKVTIQTMSGELNGGEIVLKGYQALLPSISRPMSFIQDYLSSQSGIIEVTKMNYNYQNIAHALLSATVTLNKNSIESDVTVLSGQITGVPQSNSSSNLGSSFTNFSNSINSLFQGKGSSGGASSISPVAPWYFPVLKNLSINVNFSFATPLSVNIGSYSMVKNIQSSLQGSGTLIILKGRAALLGSFYTNTGSANFMDNTYTVQSATITFQNSFQYLPTLNPNISMVLTTIVNNNAIWVNFGGQLSSMNVSFSSNNSSLTQEDIASLLAFNTTAVNISAQGAAYDVIDKGISSELFSPVTNRLGQAVGLNSLSVNANFLNSSTSGSTVSGSSVVTPEGSYTAVNNPILGLSINGSKNLYKELLTGNLQLQYSDVIPGKISSYTLTVNYNLFTNWKYKIFDTISLLGGYSKYYDLYGNNQSMGYAVNPTDLENHNFFNYLFGIRVTKSFYNPFNF